MSLEVTSRFILFRSPDLNSDSTKKGRDLVMPVGVVVLHVVERMVVPDPWFDHHTHVPLRSGLEDFLDPSRNIHPVESGCLSTRGGSGSF